MRQVNPLPSSLLTNRSVGELLGAHHREIEASCLEMAGRLGDHAHRLTLRWEDIEYELLDHMAAEERTVFPIYRRADLASERALLDEHAVLRESALEIGLAIHFRTICAEHLQRFVDRLRAHARHEEVSLYRWAQRHLDHDQRHALHPPVR